MSTQNLIDQAPEPSQFVDTISELLTIDRDTEARSLAEELQQRIEGNPEYFWYAHQIMSYLSNQFIQNSGNPRLALVRVAYTVLKLSETMPETVPEPEPTEEYLNLWEEPE